MTAEMDEGWIGVELDGTLAVYTTWRGVEQIGEPIPGMVALVQGWLAEGYEVKIVTRRILPLYWPEANAEERQAGLRAREVIEAWAVEHIGQALPVVAIEDFETLTLWGEDDARE